MGQAKADEFLRLYVTPGADHVGIGAPSSVDMIEVLIDWVERGQAPGDLVQARARGEAAFRRSPLRGRCAAIPLSRAIARATRRRRRASSARGAEIDFAPREPDTLRGIPPVPSSCSRRRNANAHDPVRFVHAHPDCRCGAGGCPGQSDQDRRHPAAHRLGRLLRGVDEGRHRDGRRGDQRRRRHRRAASSRSSTRTTPPTPPRRSTRCGGSSRWRRSRSR